MELSDSALRALVEQITVQVLQKYQPEPARLKGRVLIFTDAPAGESAVPPSGGVLWRPGMAVNFQELEEVAIASLSVTTLTKLVHFIWDTPFLEALGEALLQGAQVRVVDPKWKTGNPWKKQNGRFGLALSGLVERAKAFGVRFENDRPSAETTFQQKVLTQEDVLQYHEKGIRSVVVPSGAIVTPLAEEAAKDRGMTIRFA